MFDITFEFLGKTYYGLHHFIDTFDIEEFSRTYEATKNGQPKDPGEFMFMFLRKISDAEQGRDRDDYDWDIEEQTQEIMGNTEKEKSKKFDIS